MSRQFDRQDNPATLRRREHVFEHWRAEILRFAMDDRTLNAVAARALNHADVRADATVASQIRQYVQQRRTELAKARAQHQDVVHPLGPSPRDSITSPRDSITSLDATERSATAEDAAAIIRGLDEHLTEYVSHLYENEGEAVVARIRALCEQFPQLNQHGLLEQYEHRLGQLKRQVVDCRTQIDELEKQAIRSAESGLHDEAADCLKRLSSIHAAHPQLLPDKRLIELRQRLSMAGSRHDYRLAARQLVEREKAIAREVKQIAAIVHHFHKVARRQPPDPAEYARAKALYEKALAAMKTHDGEWLAATVLELVDLLSEWDAPPEKAQAQVDHFIESVRKSLAHIRREIREIEQEKGVSPGA
jgi:hypothetical protein